ncbi:MAG: extracellular solute-binding protein [Bacteroidia bacterium]|nr:extracellular solute-binding protein [Bacteroidia bacterium]
MIGLFFIVSFLHTGFAQETIRLATTTSVRDTGLLDPLIDVFQKKTHYKVQAIAVGSGQAMQLGRTGEVDILWVHSPDDEKQFVAEGYGIDRTTIMHNDFVILGPKNDPAQIKGIKKASDALKKLATSKALFISRGDNSGTHKKEKELWEIAGVIPEKEKYYIEVGQGMAATITMANEKEGYVLADRSTYLSLKKSVELVIVCEGDLALINYYSLILVNPDKFLKVNSKGAREFLNFLLSKEARDIIENFGKEKYNEQFFFYDYLVK